MERLGVVALAEGLGWLGARLLKGRSGALKQTPQTRNIPILVHLCPCLTPRSPVGADNFSAGLSLQAITHFDAASK